MNHGIITEIGTTDKVINTYLSGSKVESEMMQNFEHQELAPGNEFVKLKRIEAKPILNETTELITIETPINIEFEFWNYVTDKDINLSLHLFTNNEECVFNVGTGSRMLQLGLHKAVCEIPGNLLNDGIYSVSMMVVAERSYALFNFEHLVSFEVNEKRDSSGWHGKHPGIFRPQLNFPLVKI
jgi:lipopolysaccharide transport system ATP-binding protein